MPLILSDFLAFSLVKVITSFSVRIIRAAHFSFRILISSACSALEINFEIFLIKGQPQWAYDSFIHVHTSQNKKVQTIDRVIISMIPHFILQLTSSDPH